MRILLNESAKVVERDTELVGRFLEGTEAGDPARHVLRVTRVDGGRVAGCACGWVSPIVVRDSDVPTICAVERVILDGQRNTHWVQRARAAGLDE